MQRARNGISVGAVPVASVMSCDLACDLFRVAISVDLAQSQYREPQQVERTSSATSEVRPKSGCPARLPRPVTLRSPRPMRPSFERLTGDCY
jgi:hypothetical protein